MMAYITRDENLWVLACCAGGLVLGLLFRANDVLPRGTEPGVLLLSSVLGWTYFFCWTISFYPQILLNWTRKKVDGLSLDFQVLNMVGFAAYSAMNTLLFFNTPMRRGYIERHKEPPGVHVNDLAFALHALILTIVSFGQSWMYTEPNRMRVHPVTTAFCASSAAGALLSCIDREGRALIYVLSGVKVMTTMVKYLPQAVENYRNRSTAGFSFAQVLLDLIGCMLSVGQLCLDAIVLGSLGVVTGNPAKLLLGVASFLYDSCFVVQRFWYDNLGDEPVEILTETLIET
jgi:cystinosin